MLPDHPVVHRGFVEDRDVLALEVLDDRDLQGGLVVNVLDQGGDRDHARDLGGAPAALPGDQLVAPVVAGADEDGLEDAVLPDREGKLGECRAIEGEARLLRVGVDVIDLDHLDAGRPAIHVR